MGFPVVNIVSIVYDSHYTRLDACIIMDRATLRVRVEALDVYDFIPVVAAFSSRFYMRYGHKTYGIMMVKGNG